MYVKYRLVHSFAKSNTQWFAEIFVSYALAIYEVTGHKL
jgi:hypothetical protein